MSSVFAKTPENFPVSNPDTDDKGMGGSFGIDTRVKQDDAIHAQILEDLLEKAIESDKKIKRRKTLTNKQKGNVVEILQIGNTITKKLAEISNSIFALPETKQDGAISRAVCFLKLSEQEQIQALELLQNFTEQATLDKDEMRLNEIKARYQTFQSIYGTDTTNPETIIAHLKSQFKNDLVAFGAPEDRIYMNELSKIEPYKKKMYDILYYAHRKNEDIPNMKTIIPKLTKKVDKRLDNFVVTDQTTVNEYHKNKAAEARRTTNHAIPAT